MVLGWHALKEDIEFFMEKAADLTKLVPNLQGKRKEDKKGQEGTRRGEEQGAKEEEGRRKRRREEVEGEQAADLTKLVPNLQGKGEEEGRRKRRRDGGRKWKERRQRTSQNWFPSCKVRERRGRGTEGGNGGREGSGTHKTCPQFAR
jgi:hypothetical protein